MDTRNNLDNVNNPEFEVVPGCERLFWSGSQFCFARPSQSATNRSWARIAFLCVALTLGFSATLLGRTSGQESDQANSLDVEKSNSELLEAIDSLDKSMKLETEPAEDAGLKNRLIGFGVIGGAILSLLCVLFAYLRMDHATRGFYGGRLQLVAAIAAVVIVAACYFLWTQVVFQ